MFWDSFEKPDSLECCEFWETLETEAFSGRAGWVLDVPGFMMPPVFPGLLLKGCCRGDYWPGTLRRILPVSISMLTRTSTLTYFFRDSLDREAGCDPDDITRTCKGSCELFIIMVQNYSDKPILTENNGVGLLGPLPDSLNIMQEEQHYDINLSRINSCSSSMSMVRLISCNSTNEQQIYRKINHKLLHTNDVFKDIEALTSSIADKIDIEEDLVLLLLHENKWEEDKAVNRYFDGENVRFAAIRDMIKGRPPCTKETLCPVCLEQPVVYVTSCQHGCCKMCWQQHIASALDQQKAFIRCIDHECPMLLLHSFLKFLGIDLKKYIRCLSREYVSETKSLKFCPGVDCEYCFQDLTLVSKNVVCKCGTRFCFRCGKQPHQPCSCKEVEQWILLTVNEVSNEVWIKNHAKVCPACQSTIERAFGCNYMACTCGENFCYFCGKKWDEGHTSHYECPYKPPEHKSLSNNQSEALKITQLYDKFLLHNSIQKRTSQQLKTISQFREQIKQRIHIPESQTQFLQNAFEKMLDYRGIIKWSQILQFFHKDHPNYELREFSLVQFNRELEKCGFALTEFTKKIKQWMSKERNLLEINVAEFYRQRDPLVKCLTQTDNYVKRFLQQVDK